MAAQFFNPAPQFTTTTGKPIPGGKLYTYANGTTTNQTTYKEVGLSNANTNPIILDANGRTPFPVWAADSSVFSILVNDSADVTAISTIDDVSFSGAFSLSSADVLAALAANAAAVVINGSEITGTAFQSFADALTLTAAGSIDASAGAITLGTVTGDTEFSGDVSISSGMISFSISGISIASGVITATRNYHEIDTEGGASTDDLDTINGGGNGDILILKTNNSARDVVVKDGTGNIALAGGVDFTLVNFSSTIMLIYHAGTSEWLEISRSSN